MKKRGDGTNRLAAAYKKLVRQSPRRGDLGRRDEEKTAPEEREPPHERPAKKTRSNNKKKEKNVFLFFQHYKCCNCFFARASREWVFPQITPEFKSPVRAFLLLIPRKGVLGGSGEWGKPMERRNKVKSAQLRRTQTCGCAFLQPWRLWPPWRRGAGAKRRRAEPAAP